MQHRKTAIVTGASRGIGAAIAEALAAQGQNVVVNYARGASDAEALVAKIKAGGGHAIAVQADVSDPADVARLFDTAEAEFAGIDTVIANAGIMQLAPLAESDDTLFDRHIQTNLKGAFNTLREAARRTRDGGRIIGVSSTVTRLLLPTYGVYAATKAALEALTGVLAKEVRGREISVNCVSPGGTATDLFLTGKSEDLLDRMAKMSPLERLGQPQDIARTVAFLAGPDGGWINGQVIRVNGGTA